MRALIIALLTAIGAIAPAHACRIAEASSLLPIILDKPPESVEPGEVVLKVRFEQVTHPRGSTPDSIVIDCARRRIFSVVESHPLTSGVSRILVIGGSDLGSDLAPDNGEPKYVVGKLGPLSELVTGQYGLLDVDASVWLFTPRGSPY
jgi:hypothetical protein